MSTTRNHVHGNRPAHVYERLRDQIIRGRVRPGERITEVDVASRMGVSRTPVREALTRLAHEGFLVARNGSRRTQLVAAPLTSEDVAELWGIMGALESEALAGLATLGARERRRLARELGALNDAYAAAVHAHPRDPDAVSELQSRFHGVLIARCAGPRLNALHRALHPHVERYQWAYGSALQEASLARSIAEHRAIVGQVERGDVARARRAIERHWRAATSRAAALMD
jgi:DNA-binding GntR family transcriptional regulator